MAYNKLHKKDFSIAIKTGGNALDEQKFAKEATKGELFFNSNDNKLYIATTDAGLTDATLKEVQLSDYSAPFVNGFSLDFDGSNDYLDAGSSPSGLTIQGLSVWFRPDVTFTSSGTAGYLLGFGGSDIGIAFGSDWFGPVTNEVITVVNTNHLWSYAGSGVSVSANTWHHLGIRWESSSSSTNSGNSGYDIYLDGSKVGNAFGTYTSGTGTQITTQRITVGARNRNGVISSYFNGLVDELGIFTSAVSESDLFAMYNSGSGAIDLTSYSPSLWWRMGDNDGGTGSTITDLGVDSSGNPSGNNGTINGATFSTTVP